MIVVHYELLLKTNITFSKTLRVVYTWLSVATCDMWCVCIPRTETIDYKQVPPKNSISCATWMHDYCWGQRKGKNHQRNSKLLEEAELSSYTHVYGLCVHVRRWLVTSIWQSNLKNSFIHTLAVQFPLLNSKKLCKCTGTHRVVHWKLEIMWIIEFKSAVSHR